MTPWVRRGLVGLATALVVASCGGPAPSEPPAASASGANPSPAGSVEASVAPSTAPTSSVVATNRLAASGSIALLAPDGSLSLVESGGRSVPVPAAPGEAYGFPTWSPDGTRVATVRTKDADVAVVVIDAKDIAAGLRVDPLVIFQKAGIAPFYLFWSPDGKEIAFLASTGNDLALRVAPADGSAPVDGSGPGSVLRSGNPIYYDWLANDRVLAHIGTGADGFLGEVGLDGKSSPPLDGTPADFRSAVVSHDHRSIAFARTTTGLDNEVVVAGRDGSREVHINVLGPVAIAFDPTGDTLAAIGAADVTTLTTFPLGPLRLMDRSGKQRTLIDGLVASFWWSPDGKTIAAIRVVQGGPPPSPTPSDPSPSPPAAEVHLVFADVASGKVLSDPIIHLAPGFVSGIINYFDQYALSHRMWAPDGASILIPEVDENGSAFLSVRYADGRPPVTIDGAIGFWSP